MCQERCISAIPFIRDSLRNVIQMAWLRKIEIYGKLLGAPRTEKAIVLGQTKIDQPFFFQMARDKSTLPSFLLKS